MAAHRAMLPPPRRAGDPINADLLVGLLKLEESPDRTVAVAALNRAEKAAVLATADGLDRLTVL